MLISDLNLRGIFNLHAVYLFIRYFFPTIEIIQESIKVDQILYRAHIYF